MALTRPTVLPVWADAGDKTQPTDGEISIGWPVTNIPPSRQRFNWFFNWASNAVRYFSRRGLSDWKNDESYEIGDRCIGDDGKTYKSLVTANINFQPSTNPLKWERWGFSLSELWTYLTTGLNGGTCPNTGPASAPTLANPYTEYTGVTTGEKWKWTAGAWCVVGKFYGVQFVPNAGLQFPLSAGVQTTIQTFVCPRNGRIHANISFWGATPAVANAVFCEIRGNAVLSGAEQSVSTQIGEQQYVSAGMIADVLAGDVITTICYTSGAWSPFIRSGITYCN